MHDVVIRHRHRDFQYCRDDDVEDYDPDDDIVQIRWLYLNHADDYGEFL